MNNYSLLSNNSEAKVFAPKKRRQKKKLYPFWVRKIIFSLKTAKMCHFYLPLHLASSFCLHNLYDVDKKQLMLNKCLPIDAGNKKRGEKKKNNSTEQVSVCWKSTRDINTRSCIMTV